MISFEEGYEKIRELGKPLGTKRIGLRKANGRVLRENLSATRAHPALDISAMDGYALAGEFEQYLLTGEVAAGSREAFQLQPGEAMRIFTGAPIPMGCDRVLIQENAVPSDGGVKPSPLPKLGDNIRKKGGDYDQEFSIKAPRYLNPADLALIASMNYGEINVSRKPKIGIIATGNELVRAGEAKAPYDVIASNAYGIKALAENYGARAEILPIIKDDPKAISEYFRALDKYDLIVTTGGASVGKYDYVYSSAIDAGFHMDLHKIALRPGKPIMAGHRGDQVLLGLPGNPVSALVCASLFMRALIHRMIGLSGELPRIQRAKLKNEIRENGDRKQFLRANIEDGDKNFLAHVFSNQDSAALSLLSRTNAFVIREPRAPSATRDEEVRFFFLRS